MSDALPSQVWAALREEFASRPPIVRELLENAVALGRVRVDVAAAGPGAVTVTILLDGDPVLVETLEGYGGEAGVDAERIRGHWSWRRLGSIRWMIEHGFDAGGDIEALRYGV